MMKCMGLPGQLSCCLMGHRPSGNILRGYRFLSLLTIQANLQTHTRRAQALKSAWRRDKQITGGADQGGGKGGGREKAGDIWKDNRGVLSACYPAFEVLPSSSILWASLGRSGCAPRLIRSSLGHPFGLGIHIFPRYSPNSPLLCGRLWCKVPLFDFLMQSAFQPSVATPRNRRRGKRGRKWGDRSATGAWDKCAVLQEGSLGAHDDVQMIHGFLRHVRDQTFRIEEVGCRHLCCPIRS